MTTTENESDPTIYADATADLDDSQFVIFGVPFDGTSSHRSGSAQAPDAIRRESYNYETYLNRYDIDIEILKIHDMGNSQGFKSVDEVINKLPNKVKPIVDSGKFLITLGGEHSVTIPLVKTYFDHLKQNNEGLGILYLDAHLDFRNSYLEERYSHACVARRLSEIVGTENIVELGTRSFCSEEAKDAKDRDLRFYTADMVNEDGMTNVIQDALAYLDTNKIYLTLDMDVFDPSYAPGVGNPEYFGLTPWQIRDTIEAIGSYLVGADIVEVSPPSDNGNTAALAAQLIQIIICQKS